MFFSPGRPVVPCRELWDKADVLGSHFTCRVSAPSHHRQDTVKPSQLLGENETVFVKRLGHGRNDTGFSLLPPPPLPGSSHISEAGKTRSYRPGTEEEIERRTGRRTDDSQGHTDRTCRGQELRPAVLIPDPGGASFLPPRSGGTWVVSGHRHMAGKRLGKSKTRSRTRNAQ